MEVVILCGGTGTRLREETEFKPKPLVQIGPMPILWHIMKSFSIGGHSDFVLCLGYKGWLIKEFFLNCDWMANDFILNPKTRQYASVNQNYPAEDWSITFADTGLETQTGGRVSRVKKYVKGDHFLATYGDGLADVDLDKLVQFHHLMGRVATMTVVHPVSPFGVVEHDGGIARSFKEKPRLDGVINGGFFVFSTKIFDYLDDACILEEEPLRRLASEGQLAVYQHHGFWTCMDTFKDVERLNRMWREGRRPWVTWGESR